LGLSLGEYWITFVLRPGAAPITAVSKPLALRAVLLVSEERDKSGAAIEKSTAIVPINDRTARPNRAVFVRLQGNGQMLPVHQITAHGVALIFWVEILIKQVPLAFVEDEAIGVVHPAMRRSEVKVRAILFVHQRG
jgi:hypothetical protein